MLTPVVPAGFTCPIAHVPVSWESRVPSALRAREVEETKPLTNLEISILAAALAIDAFSVAASAAPNSLSRWAPFRFAASFGIFQALMPLLGAVLGAYLLTYVRAYDHWVAFGLLEGVGVKMIADALRPHRERSPVEELASFDPSRGLPLIGLSVATSIDAFGAGVSMQIAGANLWFACPIIGLVAAFLSYFGANFGRTAHRHLGRRAEALGGAVLMLLGINMLRI